MKKTIYRVVLYILGLCFMGLGVAFAIHSGLGVSPKSSLSLVLSIILNVDISYCIIAISCVHLIIQLLILRGDFKIHILLQMIPVLCFGLFVDFGNWALKDVVCSSYFMEIIFLFCSILSISLGVTLYVGVKLVPLTAEGLTLTIAKKYGIPFHIVKNLQDIIGVTIAVLLSVVGFHKLVGLREGTIISAFLVGRVIKVLQKLLASKIQEVCFE